ncbi:MAG: hypothetical protein QXP38_00585 [Nitrososphaerota archaeon]
MQKEFLNDKYVAGMENKARKELEKFYAKLTDIKDVCPHCGKMITVSKEQWRNDDFTLHFECPECHCKLAGKLKVDRSSLENTMLFGGKIVIVIEIREEGKEQAEK